MKKLLNLFNLLFFPFLIFILVTFVFWRNYVPGIVLLGWDSLHPEFNFPLNLNRILSGVWREDQGLGALASHSHMVEIARIFILWFESFAIPFSFLRYSYIFLSLLLGPLGFFFFFNYAFNNKNKTLAGSLSAFLASIFYLLNLVILQHIFVPFEMFLVQFAFLPWVFMFALRCLQEGKRSNFLWFFVVSFLASPQAYASALYWAFLASFLLFLFFYFLSGRTGKVLKRIILLLFFQFFVNFYWLLPNLYNVIFGSQTIVNAKINRLFSPEAFIRNQEYGTWKDLVSGKNFLFDWRAFDFENGTFSDLMAVWNNHLGNPWVSEIGYLFFGISFLGLVISLIKREKVAFIFLPVLFLSLFFLQNLNGPLSPLYQRLVSRFEVFREGFRMPFTKFSILYQFAITLYFGVFFLHFFNLLFKRKGLSFVGVLIFAGVLFVNLYFVKPAFDGHLISGVVKRDLPNQYFDLFDYFKKRNKARIAVFPVYTLWGWEYHNWKYEGSGFLGFGLDNPILVRDYDRWSPYNETFYNEVSNALYKYRLIDLDNDGHCQGKKECDVREKVREVVDSWNYKVIDEFEKVLEKYQVSYLLLDESILNAGGDQKLLFIPEIKDLISHSSRIEEVARFGFLTVYEFDGTGSDPVRAPSEYVKVDTNLTYSKYDPIYQKYGEYISFSNNRSGVVSYPFVNFDPRGDVQFKVEDESLVIENKKESAKVVLPINDSIKEAFGEEQGFKEGYNCDLKKKGNAVKERLTKGNFYGAYDGGVSCDWFYYPKLDRSKAYILKIKGKNLKGRSLKIYLQNLRTGRMDLEELLPTGDFDSYFVILPSDIDSSSLSETEAEELVGNTPPGYTLNVETRSFGRIASENIIEDITFIPIDIDWLYQITGLSGGVLQKEKNNLNVLFFEKYGTWGYKVKVSGEGVLQLGQGYHQGWIAFRLSDSKLKIKDRLEHIKVNGWSNGWIVDSSSCEVSSPKCESSIFIFFWPQFLEWIGFFFLGATFLILVVLKRSKAKKRLL